MGITSENNFQVKEPRYFVSEINVDFIKFTMEKFLKKPNNRYSKYPTFDLDNPFGNRRVPRQLHRLQFRYGSLSVVFP